MEVWSVKDFANGETAGSQILKQKQSGIPGSANTIAWSPDGKMLVAGSSNGTLQLWDTRRWHVAHTLSQNGAVNAVAWSPDSKALAWADADIIGVWDVRQRKQIFSYQGHANEYEHGAASVAWSADGHFIASGGNDGTVQIWVAPHKYIS
jgi:WD40 repeat protein